MTHRMLRTDPAGARMIFECRITLDRRKRQHLKSERRLAAVLSRHWSRSAPPRGDRTTSYAAQTVPGSWQDCWT